jgi:hypothetical protein
MAWATTGLLWIAAAVMLALGTRSWWMVAAATLVLSQALICMSWADARYGTILNLLFLVPVALAVAAASPWGVAQRYDRAVAGAMA